MLLAESLEQRLLDIFTRLSAFYAALYGCSLLDNTAAYCPEQPHDKSYILTKYPTIRCKNNL